MESNEQSKEEASRNKFAEKGGVPDRVFQKVDHSKNLSRALRGFVKPVRNGPKNEHDLIESRPSRAKISLAEQENGVRFQKEE